MRSVKEWADIVAGLANRREPLWRDRLMRQVDYDLSRLREVAVAAHRANTLGDDVALNVAQSGIQAMEMDWQLEWNLRNRRVAGHA